MPTTNNIRPNKKSNQPINPHSRRTSHSNTPSIPMNSMHITHTQDTAMDTKYSLDATTTKHTSDSKIDTKHSKDVVGVIVKPYPSQEKLHDKPNDVPSVNTDKSRATANNHHIAYYNKTVDSIILQPYPHKNKNNINSSNTQNKIIPNNANNAHPAHPAHPAHLLITSISRVILTSLLLPSFPGT